MRKNNRDYHPGMQACKKAKSQPKIGKKRELTE
jgi:hypothetical protein